MVSISQFLLAALAIVQILAYPNAPLSKRSGSATQWGTDPAGLRYSFWTEGGGGNVFYDHSKENEFSVTWTDAADFVCGKGWEVGSHRVISYSAELETGEHCFLAVYSKTKNPTIEYYIVDNYGTNNQWPEGDHRGTVTTDGDTYDIYTDSPIDNNSNIPGATFRQFWSVRRTKRTSGTINTAAHFNAWASHGMVVDPSLGDQIMAIEAYRSTGSSKVIVSEGYVDLSTPPNSHLSGSSTPSIVASSSSSTLPMASSTSQTSMPTVQPAGVAVSDGCDL